MIIDHEEDPAGKKRNVYKLNEYHLKETTRKHTYSNGAGGGWRQMGRTGGRIDFFVVLLSDDAV